MTNDLAWMRPKLAELCGFTLHGRYYALKDGGAFMFAVDHKQYASDVVWRPDEDVAQAIRCLERPRVEASIKRTAGVTPRWTILLDDPQGNSYRESDILPRAICLAIASALKWEKP